MCYSSSFKLIFDISYFEIVFCIPSFNKSYRNDSTSSISYAIFLFSMSLNNLPNFPEISKVKPKEMNIKQFTLKKQSFPYDLSSNNGT